MEVERHEAADVRWEVARRVPSPALRSVLAQALEGWTREGSAESAFRELPFPGVPLIFNLGAPWTIDGDPRFDSFVAGLHTTPTSVGGARAFSCVELRLGPIGARRLLGRPMHELANLTVPIDELMPGADELSGRLHDARSWDERFDLVEAFLARRLDRAAAPPPEVEWAWLQLRRSSGRVPIASLADELQWSPRRLIARFREHVGLAPKTAARVIRFDRAVASLRSGLPAAQVAADCGYADQAHLNREFRELAGTTPVQLLAA
jgi:AraC-like DNA-binding protein